MLKVCFEISQVSNFRIDIVNNIIEEKEEKNFLPSEIREKNIIEKFFKKISNIIKYIFS